MDKQWWLHHIDEVKTTFAGERVTIATLLHRFGTTQLRRTAFETYNNSGAGAVSLALMRGAQRIILLGYDLQYTAGARHWHGNHPRGLGNAGSVARWPQAFRRLRKALDAAGIEYINCTRATALDWPREDLETVLERRIAQAGDGEIRADLAAA